MDLGLKINQLPLRLGHAVPHDHLEAAQCRRAGLLRRLFRRQPIGQAVYDLDDCELQALDDELHIYPCTHGYLNRDRQWHTRVTLFLRKERLERVLFQVVEGQTAALNFLERFQSAAERRLGAPDHQDRRRARWLAGGARVETYLHPDRVNADFLITLDD